MWDFGSAARHHELYNPWLGDGRSRAGISTLRGAMSPESGRAEDVAEKIRVELEQRGLLGEPIGVDAIEPAVLFALQAAGHRGRRRPAADAAGARDQDAGRDHAAQHRLHDGRRRLRGALPGDAAGHARERVRRARQQGALRHGLGVRRGRQRDLRRALQPAPARLHRPARCAPATRPTSTSCTASWATARATTARSRSAARRRPLVDAYKRCRYYLDAAIALIRPGVTTGDVVSSSGRRREEFGFPDEEAAFALQFGHGVGLSIWEKPVFSRLVSLDHPEEIEEGMVFALETFWPASRRLVGGADRGAARRHPDGCEVITRFPAEDLLIAGQPYYTPAARYRSSASASRTSTRKSTPMHGRRPRRTARPPATARRGGCRSPTPEPASCSELGDGSAALTEGYPRFSDREMTDRAERLDALLAASGAAHVAVYGANRFGSAVAWLTGWPVTREAVVIHTPGERDLLLVNFYNHVPNARALAPGAEVEWAGGDAIGAAIAALRRRGAAGDRLAVIGPLGHRGFARLNEFRRDRPRSRQGVHAAAPGQVLRGDRMDRTAAILTDAGVAAMRDAAQPGVTDHELAAAVEGAYVKRGATTHIHYFGATPMARPNLCVPAQWPSGRALRAGDVLSSRSAPRGGDTPASC